MSGFFIIFVFMKYIVIDIETTGTDPNKNQILELGAIFEDTNTKLPIEEIPKFKCIIEHQNYIGSAYAINMNQRIFKIISDYKSIKNHIEQANFRTLHNILTPHFAVMKFAEWVQSVYFQNNDNNLKFTDNINIAGKNYGVFDKLFLDNLEYWKQTINCERRFIDPAILFTDWKNDSRLPSLDQCLERANIKRQVTHNALEDAIDVLLCLRTQY